jgi:cytoskeletal protein CcmA (bactofilin family)
MSALLAVFAVLLAGYVVLRATRVAVRARHQKLFHSQGEPSDITTSATSTLGGPDQSFSIQGDDLMTARIAPTAQAGGVRAANAANAPTLLTILGASAKIEGIFEVEESIEVQCEISGELRVGGTLVIGERGRVSADVTTVNAIINGSYTGNLKASGSVEIAATGRVSGTLESSELVIAKGGVFTGSVTHVETETQDELETEALVPQSGMLTDVEKPIPVTRLIELDLGKGISSARAGGAFQPRAH